MTIHSSTQSSCMICLVRHGETSWNAERRLQGHIDIPLNHRGVAQAESTARSMADVHFAAMYSSDLQRAHDTARAIANRRAQQPRTDPRLRERHYGVFQGLTYDEASARFPEAYARFKARDIVQPIPGDGESLATFATRVTEALAEIAQRHAGARVLVVTHGGVLDIAHRLAAGKPLHTARDFTIPNAALNWIEHEAGQWRLLDWGDERHLADALDELPTT
ncbi:MAG: histidine phosphatase family protein [Betaproteobacteria bacterium]|nr:MAG: histidine phosphatase family protein [Betaproteobacteria bacterium]